MTDIRNIKIPPPINRLPLSERETEGHAGTGWQYTLEGQKFDFTQGKIFLNQQDLAKHIQENLTHLGAHYWSSLSRRLANYRDWVAMHIEDPEQLGKFLSILHGFLTVIYGRIQKKYDETLDGVSFHLEEGQLLINGINVGACLQMVRRRRTKKGLLFLKGLRNRLAVLQSNRTGSASYERIRETVERLGKALDQELNSQTSPVIELPMPKTRLS